MHAYKKPLSVIIAEDLKKRIDRGIYKYEDQLPAEVVLAKEMGVSRVTLRDALSILERQGLITRKHGVGSFIAQPEKHILSSFDKMDSLIDLIRRSGYEATINVLEITHGELSPQVCNTLEIPTDSQGFTFNTMYSANGIPLVYTNEYVEDSLLPKHITTNRADCEDLADFISRNTGKAPTATLTQLKGILPTKELMRILMIDPHSPIIRQKFTLFNKHQKRVGCGYDFLNSSWFEFSIYTNTIRL